VVGLVSGSDYISDPPSSLLSDPFPQLAGLFGFEEVGGSEEVKKVLFLTSAVHSNTEKEK